MFSALMISGIYHQVRVRQDCGPVDYYHVVVVGCCCCATGVGFLFWFIGCLEGVSLKKLQLNVKAVKIVLVVTFWKDYKMLVGAFAV
ncbi:putative inosine/xanthosine triphosphatase [Frankliniella fusca]|uniref:Inosine/xanthosine triphosphatase n=1 Tax=Frankliniella fusca TaxID=407009 RepID=A0AAE1LGW6_9NEOP|nr:putative inosine/xanthosine triphosphatase [Frankliniella fusca]